MRTVKIKDISVKYISEKKNSEEVRLDQIRKVKEVGNNKKINLVPLTCAITSIIYIWVAFERGSKRLPD